jgi:hypothetical protein
MTTNTDHVIRSNLWSANLKENFEDQLMGMQYVDWITDFPDGDIWNIPSVGQLQALDYVEGQAAKYNKMDTGNFTLQITEYKQAGVAVTEKFKQDSMWAPKIMSRFVPEMTRAIQTSLEADIMNLGPESQTAGNTNTINGAFHRWVGQGAGDLMSNADFARAKYSFTKAGVPLTNLVAIVDPSVAFHLETQTGLVDVTYNPKWEGVIETGLVSGMRFIRNIYGFDVWESNFLKTGLAETIDSEAVTNGVANLFFSAAPEARPFIGAMRQPPKVDSGFNKDLQQEEYITTARWGLGLYRPESLCVVITDNSTVYA